jgi:hypothetical protein
MVVANFEKCKAFSHKLNIELPWDPIMPPLGVYLKSWILGGVSIKASQYSEQYTFSQMTYFSSVLILHLTFRSLINLELIFLNV